MPPVSEPWVEWSVLSVNLCVCVCWRSPLASPCDGRTHQSSRIFPAIGFWVCSLETWDDGAQRLLTLKISLRRLGGQPTVGASAQSVVLTASHSSFIEVLSTVCVYSVCTVCAYTYTLWQSLGMHWPRGQKVKVTQFQNLSRSHGCYWSALLWPLCYCCQHETALRVTA